MTTFTMFLFMVIMTLSMAAAESESNDACDLTMDGTLGTMRGWFWSSASSSSCSQQSDCTKNVECCQDGKCTWVDWVAPLIFTLLLLVGLSVVMCFIGCFLPADFFDIESLVLFGVFRRLKTPIFRPLKRHLFFHLRTSISSSTDQYYAVNPIARQPET